MAQSLQLLNRRIKTSKNIAQISKAMEMISASKIKRAQKAVENNKPYAERIVTLTHSILKHIDQEKFHHPYLDGNNSDKT
ncbi:MAG TPA: F0F1 ATP synthase subunit gamma, partial [Patescibacteria group bacterium]|nr:F0F1 ATP synthase subunit gamma [Patescibacteria group bacterium]